MAQAKITRVSLQLADGSLPAFKVQWTMACVQSLQKNVLMQVVFTNLVVGELFLRAVDAGPV
jgi:hypothetical protein